MTRATSKDTRVFFLSYAGDDGDYDYHHHDLMTIMKSCNVTMQCCNQFVSLFLSRERETARQRQRQRHLRREIARIMGFRDGRGEHERKSNDKCHEC